MTNDPIKRFQKRKFLSKQNLEVLQSIGAADVSDFALKATRTVGPAYVRLTVLPALLGLLGIVFLVHFVIEPFLSTTHPESLPLQMEESAARIGLGIFVALPLILICLSWMNAVSILFISNWMVGKVPTDAELESQVAKRLWPAMASFLRTYLIGLVPLLAALPLLLLSVISSGDLAVVYSLFGWVAILIQVIWTFFYLRYQGIAVQIVVIEKSKSSAAAKRSRDLLSGRKGMGSIPFNTLALQQLVTLIGFFAILLGLSLPAELVDFQSALNSIFGNGWISNALGIAISFIPAFAAIWFCMFYMSVVTTFIYFQCRFRFEGYDIELLGADAVANISQKP